jgi:sulfur carrier protein
MAFAIVLNGQNRTFPNLVAPVPLAKVIVELNLKGDRIAVEHNAEIAPRTRWDEITVVEGDRLEIVHFVGGGCADQQAAPRPRKIGELRYASITLTPLPRSNSTYWGSRPLSETTTSAASNWATGIIACRPNFV